MRRFVVGLGCLGASVVSSGGLVRAADVGQEAPSAEAALADGAFSALTLPARVGSTRAFAWGLAGYDSSRKGPLLDSTAEVQLWGPIALRGSATYSNDTRRMRPSVAARGQFLHQSAHALDASLTVFYKAEGFTESEGEIETALSVGRTFERLTLIGNLVYGQDPEGNERDGELRLSLFHQRGGISFGLDARARMAIGPQQGKASAVEPTFDAMGGATAAAALGPLVLFAEVGPSVFRLAGVNAAGMEALGGVGSVF